MDSCHGKVSFENNTTGRLNNELLQTIFRSEHRQINQSNYKYLIEHQVVIAMRG